MYFNVNESMSPCLLYNFNDFCVFAMHHNRNIFQFLTFVYVVRVRYSFLNSVYIFIISLHFKQHFKLLLKEIVRNKQTNCITRLSISIVSSCVRMVLAQGCQEYRRKSYKCERTVQRCFPIFLDLLSRLDNINCFTLITLALLRYMSENELNTDSILIINLCK